MKIAITGTPGTGKTEVSKIVAKSLDYKLFAVNDFAKDKGLVEDLDVARDSYIIDESKLKGEFKKIKGNCVLEGHISQFCDMDFIIVLRTNPKELKRRLLKRDWSAEKIAENIDAEIAGVCLEESLNCNVVVEIDTSQRTSQATSTLILDIIRDKLFDKYSPGKIDWVEYL
ncbi:MAG: adenylate kinase family protein [DPANN group archaeon]|nr:adenylate kinase family protein [DPANN group archaeon]